jgi:hypothetical protein
MCTHCVGDGLVEGAVAGGAGAQGLRRRTQAGGARANADGISPRPTRADVHVLQHPESSANHHLRAEMRGISLIKSFSVRADVVKFSTKKFFRRAKNEISESSA